MDDIKLSFARGNMLCLIPFICCGFGFSLVLNLIHYSFSSVLGVIEDA